MARYPDLNAAVHYVISRCQPDELGAIKLNKILWFSDLEYLEKTGRSITQDEYVKLQFGPVPKHTPTPVRELTAQKRIVSKEISYFGRLKTEYWALEEPDISGFDPIAISILDKMIDWVCKNHTAASISDRTHDMLWEGAEIGEVIPLGAALAFRAGEITAEDMEWARKGLQAAG